MFMLEDMTECAAATLSVPSTDDKNILLVWMESCCERLDLWQGSHGEWQSI